MNLFGLIIGGIIVAIIAVIAYIIYKIKTFADAINPFECLSDSECLANEYCGGIPVKCRSRGALGESCGEDRACESGSCGDLSFKCSPPLDAAGKKVVNAECAQGSNECGVGLFCKMTPSAYSVCTPLLPTDAYCNGVAAGGECLSGECGPNSKCQPPRGPNGLKTVGATCVGGFNECENNLLCGPNSLCMQKSGVGGTCVGGSSHCLPGLFCGPNSECKKPGATGDYCNGVSAGYECASGECGPNSKCQPPRGPNGLKTAGATCVGGQNQCETNLYCAADSLCTPMKDVGGTCVGGSSHCLPGLFCGPNSQCKKPGATGDYCNGVAAGGECASGECGPDSKCQPPRGPTGLKTAGSTCVGGQSQCESGLYCAADSICTSKKNIGARCDSGSEQCLPGLFCDLDSKCKQIGGTGAYCNGAAAGGECVSGECGHLSFKCQPPRDAFGKKPFGSECVAGSNQCSSGLTCTFDWGKGIHFCE